MASTTGNDISAYYVGVIVQVYNIVGSILTVIGSVGAVLCCIVFTEKTMRKNPGSVYFIAYNLANLFDLLLTLLPVVLANITQFDLSQYSSPYCKIEFYLRLLFPVLSRYYLILASIDRTLITSSKALVRQRSNHHLAYWSIIGVTVITVLFYIHLLVGIDIYQLFPGYYICYYQPGNYKAFTVYSNLLITGIGPWVFLSIFATYTLKNLHRVRVQPVSGVPTAINTHRTKDRQFTIMLLSEILTYIIFNSWTPLYEIYKQMTEFQSKSTEQNAIELFLLNLFFVLTFVNPATCFYVNLVVSKTFRQKTMELFCTRCQHRLIHNSQSQNPTGGINVNHPAIE